MICKALPKTRLIIPQILTQQRRPVITLLMLTLSLPLALGRITIRMDLARVRMERIQEPLDRRGSFVEEGVVRVSRFHDRADLHFCDEDT